MTRTSTGTRMRYGAVVLALAAALTLTGCGPADAGSAAADEFEQAFSDVDGIASVETSGSNNLPFVGSVTATVTTEPGLTPDRIDELAAELADHMREADSISWAVAISADGLTTGISEDDATTELRLTLTRRLASEPHVVAARVAVEYERPVVLVEVDAPEALSAGYAAAAEAVDSLGSDTSATSAGAVSGPEAAFSVDDESRDGEDTAIGTPLRIFEAALSRFALTSAHISPDALRLRVADEGDVEALESVIDAIPVPEGLEIEVQGGKTTREPDATPAADAVASALREHPGVSTIHASGGYVNVVLTSHEEADDILTTVADVPGFLSLDGFGLREGTFFRAFDRPEDFASTLEIAQAAAALPSVTSVDASRAADETFPTLALRFDSADESVLSGLATSLKPDLVAGGWHVWLNADGFVEAFDAQDRIVLDERVTGRRDEPEQDFADMLVRVWNQATG